MSTLYSIARNVANIYAEANTDSEMVSQGVMGHPVVILESRESWSKIETADGYSGWVKSHWICAEEFKPQIPLFLTALFADAFIYPDRENPILTRMVITTRLSEIERAHGLVHASTPGGNEIWVSEGSVCNTLPHPVNPSGEDIVSTAQRFMGTPYLWGGSTPFGIDCSGLTQLVYRLHGMELRRDAWMQAEDPRFRPLEREELTAGDLVFFARESGTRRISHVGIAMGNGEFIHARGSGEGVRINKISDEPYVTIFKTAARVVRKR